LSLDAQRLEAWPAFLLDIIPSGAAARFWAQRLFLQGPHKQIEHHLLTRATVSPVGHMRV
jgi:serine/threonine-protein kinase HipA